MYVLKYCSNFAELFAPLIDATCGKTKHEVIVLYVQQLQCFEQLKIRLSSPPILVHPASSRPFHRKTDASDYATGGYLFQMDDDGRGRIIAYSGRKLNAAESTYPTHENELFACYTLCARGRSTCSTSHSSSTRIIRLWSQFYSSQRVLSACVLAQ